MTTTTPLASTETAPAAAADAAPVRTLGIVALVLGVASLAFGANPVLGAAAVVLGILGLRREQASRSFSIAGIVTGGISLIGIVFAIVAVLFALPFLGIFAAAPFWW